MLFYNSLIYYDILFEKSINILIWYITFYFYYYVNSVFIKIYITSIQFNVMYPVF